MDEFAVGRHADARRSRFNVRIGSARYPIVSHDEGSCLIRAPHDATLRGFADIYEGERLQARCLVVLAGPEGDLIRLTYKRRSPALTTPPRDFAGE